jgi:hypothetical protein
MTSQPRDTAEKAPAEYPETTEGSRIARNAREMCNGMSEEERERHLAAALRLIHGNPPTPNP